MPLTRGGHAEKKHSPRQKSLHPAAPRSARRSEAPTNHPGAAPRTPAVRTPDFHGTAPPARSGIHRRGKQPRPEYHSSASRAPFPECGDPENRSGAQAGARKKLRAPRPETEEGFPSSCGRRCQFGPYNGRFSASHPHPHPHRRRLPWTPRPRRSPKPPTAATATARSRSGREPAPPGPARVEPPPGHAPGPGGAHRPAARPGPKTAGKAPAGTDKHHQHRSGQTPPPAGGTHAAPSARSRTETRRSVSSSRSRTARKRAIPLRRSPGSGLAHHTPPGPRPRPAGTPTRMPGPRVRSPRARRAKTPPCPGAVPFLPCLLDTRQKS